MIPFHYQGMMDSPLITEKNKNKKSKKTVNTENYFWDFYCSVTNQRENKPQE